MGEDRKLLLFGTAGCHLCEDAALLLRRTLAPRGDGEPFAYVDIADDSELTDRYGVRIPVLLDIRTGIELDWPFDVDKVLDFLRSLP